MGAALNFSADDYLDLAELLFIIALGAALASYIFIGIALDAAELRSTHKALAL